MRGAAFFLAVLVGAVAVSGCAGSAKQPPQQVHVGIGAAQALQAREIEVARASSGLLSIFPTAPGERRCLIPSGGIAPLKLHGFCRTSVRLARNRREPLVVVSFTERWATPSACLHSSASCSPVGGERRHSWLIWIGPPVRLGQKPVVLATHTRGAFPPQFND